MTSGSLRRWLVEHGIAYEHLMHEALWTCEDVARVMPPDVDAVHTKNLFVRDKKGRRHWLLVTSCEKAVDLKAVADAIGVDNLSFASPDRLQRHLGVIPGAVTVMGLVHESAREVALLVDRDVWAAARLCCHPLVNDETLVIGHDGLVRFLELTGHAPQILTVPTRG
ncbi:MAG TPA: prolyl-tRNA synthetase associated domain-containing protein [Gemmatimonadaceae bacterium]|nr:prolyl-tRNA synthetase associated domain-containing protein [Gemmatimonadaceae bacterium]